MRSLHLASILSIAIALVLSASSGCSSANAPLVYGDGGSSSSGSGSGSSSGGGTGASSGGCTGFSCGSSGGGVTCAAGTGKQCINTTGGCNTQITGTVYDPAGQNPIYNVAVYVPSAPLLTLPKGVACGSCQDLYTGNPIAAGVTDAKGNFTIPNAPAAASVPLVVQIGKWRKAYTVQNVTECQTTQVTQKLTLPGKMDPNDSAVSMPDIAISTGGADSLECLLKRIGVDDSEFVGGAGKGHIHIFAGYNGATASAGTPSSYSGLWDSKADIEANDVVLLSCEGSETRDSGNQLITATDQAILQQYANDGGRVFASHFHYKWFNDGPLSTPALATWVTGSQTILDTQSFPGVVTQTLANGQPFPEGVALQQWLTNVGALTNGQLPIWYARHNVTTTNFPPVQQWITLDKSVGAAPGAPQYFSFDTGKSGEGGVCGRVVYSDLHVSGGPGQSTNGVPGDYPGFNFGGVVPSGCAAHPLTPQEKALEFMLFDLSSCIITPGNGTKVPNIVQ